MLRVDNYLTKPFDDLTLLNAVPVQLKKGVGPLLTQPEPPPVDGTNLADSIVFYPANEGQTLQNGRVGKEYIPDMVTLSDGQIGQCYHGHSGRQ